MMLAEIPSGSIVCLDANILIYANYGTSKECIGLIERITNNEVSGIIPATILAEVMHNFMIAEAKMTKKVPVGNPARYLSENPALVKSLYLYERSIRELSLTGVHIEPLTKEDLFSSFSLQQKFGMLTNDSLLIAVAARLGINKIVSADKSFKRVSHIQVYAPGDLPS